MSKEIEKFLSLPKVHKDWIDKFVVMSAFGRPPTLYATAVLAFKVLEVGLPGDFCECGVAAGVHPAVMHYVQRFMFGDNAAKFRKIFMFDSFEGIPKATTEDIPTEDHMGEDQRGCVGYELAEPGKMESSGFASVPLADVQNRMARWGARPADLHYVVGWVEETMPTAADKIDKLSILRLDLDLYSGTKVSLEHLYPKVVQGGYIIVDDWRLAGVRRAIDEHFGRTPRVTEIPGGAGPVFWRKT